MAPADYRHQVRLPSLHFRQTRRTVLWMLLVQASERGSSFGKKRRIDNL